MNADCCTHMHMAWETCVCRRRAEGNNELSQGTRNGLMFQYPPSDEPWAVRGGRFSKISLIFATGVLIIMFCIKKDRKEASNLKDKTLWTQSRIGKMAKFNKIIESRGGKNQRKILKIETPPIGEEGGVIHCRLQLPSRKMEMLVRYANEHGECSVAGQRKKPFHIRQAKKEKSRWN